MSEMHLVRNWYEALAKGDIESVTSAMAPDIEWRQAEGHPYQPSGAPWSGVAQVSDNLFGKLATQFESFRVNTHVFHDASPTIVVEGRYTGTFKTNGRRINAQFCHLWHVRDGKLASFQQYTDTGQLQAMTNVPVLQELLSGLG